MDYSGGGDAGSALFGGVVFFAMMGFGLLIYAYFAYALMVIADKTGTENGWLAWIPVANIYLMCLIAEKPVWWIVLCFIPFVNIIAMIMLWMGIATRRGKPEWWGLLMLIPVVNFVVPGYLAFTE